MAGYSRIAHGAALGNHRFRVTTAEGPLELRRRGRDFLITIAGRVLMTSAARRSEEDLARIALEGRPDARVLIGGLGMGFTLRAALDALSPAGRVVVAELTPEVAAWCRGPMAGLTDDALADPRVEVRIGDVAREIRGVTARYDAILLDLYEGPNAATQYANDPFYGGVGLFHAGARAPPRRRSGRLVRGSGPRLREAAGSHRLPRRPSPRGTGRPRARRVHRHPALSGLCCRTYVRTVLPQRARVVVVGGGVIGCSVAYHLAHMGWKDVVLLERDRLTSGTTWHAAGLMVTFGSTSETSTEMRKYTAKLYARLEEETGQATGFKPVGFIEVAADADRLEDTGASPPSTATAASTCTRLSPRRSRTSSRSRAPTICWPASTSRRTAAPTPSMITMALAKGARLQGAKIIEGVAVTGISKKRGVVTGVQTSLGDIEAEYVVNCAGMWARQLGAKAGVNIPTQAAEHYYLITERVKGLSTSFPVLEDPGSFGYFREEVGGPHDRPLRGGLRPLERRRHPRDFSFGSISPTGTAWGPYVEKAMSRVPISMDGGVRKFFCGPRVHPGPPAHRRRGARGEELLRSPRD
jgi:glycine/D-amino acid oxidase-like deaminating enzyme